VIERRFRARPPTPTKAKGRFLLRDLAPSVPIFGDPVLVPDHNASYRESFGTHEPKPAFTSLFYDDTRCKSFPTTAHFQLPGPSLVADSRRRLLVRSLLWKITLPLKAIVLSGNNNASDPCNFLLWK
jgi:hypothetical protein